ncbi:MAG: sodium/glutamate symporter [Candidatus Methanomethylophilaceae archaeon]|nr:sodium/glutamate symporter [Candidatus Methanomethylophilaceae archaeon]MBR6911229.1 sodium/glutamate symporter [Candidatus Methanomethylophilaceae archaeon]
MMELELDMYQSAAVGALVLVIGGFLVMKSPLLRKFCIPAAVVGGLLFSIVMLFLHEGDVVGITFDDTIKDICMRVFFCSVGFMASFSMLRSGGRILVIMIVLSLVMIVMQDAVGIFTVSAFGLDPKYGLALGSISLVGGHGTAAAYGEVLVKDYGLVGGDVVAIAAATFGLAIAGMLGGPLAKRLIEKNGLRSSAGRIEKENIVERIISSHEFLVGLMLIVICMGLGTLINGALDMIGIALPTYLGALIMAIIVRNIADVLGYTLPYKEIETIGWICLSLFLSMALMSMKLWQLADLAAVMIITLLIQTVVLSLFVYHFVFKLTGANYDSATLVSGTMGFGMGATPNAVANVEAIIEAHGPAPVAYFLVPLIGGVFMDLLNVSVLTVLLNIL